MKIKYIIPITLLVIACGQEREASSNSKLETKKKALEEARKERQSIEATIATLEKEIEKIDPEAIHHNIALVAVFEAKQQPFEHRIVVRGNAKSRKNIQLSTQVSGLVNRIYVEEGQRVNKGQLLLSLDATVLKNTIAEQKKALELATSIYGKRKKLWAQQIGSEIQYLEAQNKKESLERKLMTTKSQLEQTRIKAPFTGTVEDIKIKEGELATPGNMLCNIANPQAMYLQADVSEKYIDQFHVEDKVDALFPSRGKVYKTSIKAVGQVINNRNRTFEIEVKMPQVPFRIIPNQVVVLKLQNYYMPHAWVVPSRVIQQDNSGYFIFCIKTRQGKAIAIKVPVEIGKSYDNNTEVIKGIGEKDQIVYHGLQELANGTEVKVVADEKQIAE